LVLKGHTGGLESIRFSPDGKLLASSSQDATVRIWEAATGKLRHTLKGHESEIDSVAFSADGKTVASGCKDKTLKLGDVETGGLRRTVRGTKNRLESLAFAPDGSILARVPAVLSRWSGFGRWSSRRSNRSFRREEHPARRLHVKADARNDANPRIRQALLVD